MKNGLEYVQIFETARTAHLERLQTDTSVHLFYRRESYDFEVSPAAAGRVHRVTMMQLLVLVASGRARRIELNEPLYFRSWPLALPLVAIHHLMRRLKNRDRSLVFYLIDNGPVADYIATRTLIPHKFALWAIRRVVSFMLGEAHRVAFGTVAARENYLGYGFNPHSTASVLHTAIEPRCACASDLPGRPMTVLFVGRLDSRKGIEDLIRVWPTVVQSVPLARLVVVGGGPLEQVVRNFSNTRDDVEVVGHADHATIHKLMRMARAVCLPSQPLGPWREQIGLPLLEGLSHGCQIVTTSETGIADWLSARGHFVVSPGDDADLAGALVQALVSPERAKEIFNSLPKESSRRSAHFWLAD